MSEVRGPISLIPITITYVHYKVLCLSQQLKHIWIEIFCRLMLIKLG